MEILPRRGIMAGIGNEEVDKITVRDDDQPNSGALSETHPGSNVKFAGLLSENDPAPVTILRAEANSPFVIVMDHAGRAIPSSLGTLGLAGDDLSRHIAWDIGVAGTGALLAESLGAALLAQTYSRLVIDCNRRPGHPTSIAPRSDGSDVPGNQRLSEPDAELRVREIFAPYHERITSVLDARAGAGLQTVIVALHSFTPRLQGKRTAVDRPSGPAGGDNGGGDRPWHVGVLHNHDPRFALRLRDLLQAEGDLVVGDNEPYALSDLDDYTVPVHAEQRSLPHVEIEIRQDLISDAAGEAAWAARLARLLPAAWALHQAATR